MSIFLFHLTDFSNTRYIQVLAEDGSAKHCFTMRSLDYKKEDEYEEVVRLGFVCARVCMCMCMWVRVTLKLLSNKEKWLVTQVQHKKVVLLAVSTRILPKISRLRIEWQRSLGRWIFWHRSCPADFLFCRGVSVLVNTVAFFLWICYGSFAWRSHWNIRCGYLLVYQEAYSWSFLRCCVPTLVEELLWGFRIVFDREGIKTLRSVYARYSIKYIQLSLTPSPSSMYNMNDWHNIFATPLR